MKERLQKILAARGVASRREAEKIIQSGRVSVNGAIAAALGSKADPELDVIAVDGIPLPSLQTPRVLMLNKPPGYVSTSRTSREIGPAVTELVPSDRRYFPVGRLDRESTGLILLTDNGDLAHRLTHPKFGISKVYHVETRYPLSAEHLRVLRRGVLLEDGLAKVVAVERLSQDRLRITLAEGRKREIRRMIDALGSRVETLHRIQIGSLELGDLPIGQWRELNSREIALLLRDEEAPSGPNHEHASHRR